MKFSCYNNYYKGAFSADILHLVSNFIQDKKIPKEEYVSCISNNNIGWNIMKVSLETC